MQRASQKLMSVVIAIFLVAFAATTNAKDGVRTSLFNGKDLTGWVVTGCKAVVRDGALLLEEGNGFVRTEHRYGDFILELKWRALKPDTFDSGIFFRCDAPPEGKPWPPRYQANLKQGQEGNVGGLPKAVSNGLAKLGQWNEFKLTVTGDQAKLELNGQPAWESGGVAQKVGYIGLQAEVPLGGQFEFKDIYVTELKHRPLFNGSDLSGWEGAGRDAKDCWTVEDGQLKCTGEKGPWLRSTEQFADFNLRLEYKLKAGGNSGVYVRVPEDGNHHGDGSGIEIQILDDNADRYRELKPYQYTGSLYAIVPAESHVGREIGQWNSLEIDCQGDSYLVIHNGTTIVKANGESAPELSRRRKEGFLGLQNHSEEVWFRNVRLGPSSQTMAPAKADEAGVKNESRP
jgi:hypothetical protein